MWQLGMWFSSERSGAGLIVGLEDLRGLFHPQPLCHSTLGDRSGDRVTLQGPVHIAEDQDTDVSKPALGESLHKQPKPGSCQSA